MRRAWKKIEQLIKANARHRKGFCLQDAKPPFILSQAEEELRELSDDPDDPVEMADLLGILFHYSIKQGWTLELLESLLIEKLNLRFTKSEGEA